ncbi:MAG: SoxR reducing system RseC family protein [Candidatus Muiribacteriota bacterium]
MRTCAIVKNIQGDKLFLEHIRNSACAECHSADVCLENTSRKEIVEVPLNASEDKLQVDDKVKLTVNLGTSPYIVLFVIYCVPVLFFSLGIFLMYFLNFSELIQFFTGLAALFVGLFITVFFDKWAKKNNLVKYKVELDEKNN